MCLKSLSIAKHKTYKPPKTYTIENNIHYYTGQQKKNSIGAVLFDPKSRSWNAEANTTPGLCSKDNSIGEGLKTNTAHQHIKKQYLRDSQGKEEAKRLE